MKTRIALIAAAALLCAPSAELMAQNETPAHSFINHTNNIIKEVFSMIGVEDPTMIGVEAPADAEQTYDEENQTFDDGVFDRDIDWNVSVSFDDDDDEFGHLPGLFIGPNFLMQPGTLTSQTGIPMREGRGFELGFGLYHNGFAFNRGQNVGLVYGLSITRSRYKLKGNDYLDWNNGSLTLFNAPGADKTIMRYWTLQVPVLFEICAQTGKQDLFVNFGVQGEYRFGDMSKIKWGRHDKEKVTRDLNLNTFGASAVAQLGISDNLAIYARYSLTSLFKEDSPVEATPFTIGLSFGF